MKRFDFLFVVVLTLLLNCGKVYSIPARPTPFVLKQPNGTELTVKLHGDENHHYYTTPDGYLLLPDNNGVLCYAGIQAGNLVATTQQATEIKNRTANELNYLRSVNKDDLLQSLQAKVKTKEAQFKLSQRIVSQKYPTMGNQKALVILVQFTDRKFSVDDPLNAFDNMINQPGYSKNGGTGSARDFFIENSDGQYLPEFDVFGPVTLANKMSYYGGNDRNDNDQRPEEMVIEACKQLDSSINFADYDRDKDGFVDNVYVFYAGYGEADGGPKESVWPHAWEIYGGANKTLILDGVQINRYACSNELDGGSGTNMTGIGTICHEFSHVLGLPDLYATSYTSAFTPDAWSLMDLGSYNNDGRTPPYMSAYERYALGWIKPAVVTTADTTFVLPAIAENKAFIVKTAKENEYFLLENRQQNNWDTYIPGHGMLVWHIDYNERVWENNVVNNTPTHQYVDIEEADGTQTEGSRNGDAFPGSAKVTSITDDTKPNLKSWDGSRQNLSIFNIKEEDGLITFNVIDPRVKLDTPVSKEATKIGSSSFQANWEKSSKVLNYEIDVYKKTDGNSNYLSDYQDLKLNNSDSLLVTGLEPETDYYYVIRSITDLQSSNDSEEIHVKTTASGMDAFTPVANEATSVSWDSFIANWEDMEDADDYLLYVFKKTAGEDMVQENDFTGGIASMPEGWETTCSATYNSSGYYGESSPSLKFDKDKLTLESPVTEGKITSLSFWCRGASASEQNELKIDGFDGDNWNEIFSISPIDNSAKTYMLSEEEYFDKSYSAIRLTYFKNGSGNLALDDVKLESGGTQNEMISGYDGKNTGKVSTILVENLECETDYYYMIKAISGDLTSKLSNEISVTTNGKPDANKCLMLIPDDISVSSAGNTITVENRTSNELNVEIYNPLGLLIKTQKLPEGSSRIDLTSGQIYILKIGSLIVKTVL